MSYRTLFPGKAFIALLCAAAPGIVLAADGPGSAIQPGVVIEGETVEANLAPSIPFVEPVLPVGGTLQAQEIPADAEQKGSVYTDGNFVKLPLPANAIERAKLEMARAAIEASRLAGTLFVVPSDPADTYTTEDLEAIKRQRLEAMTPIEIAHDPAAGVADFPPVQEHGSPGLTPEEEAKLTGETPTKLEGAPATEEK
jgi:hypothetical protein